MMPLAARAPYSELARSYDAALGLNSFASTRQAFEELVRRYGIRFGSAADVGCGTGLFARYLSRCCKARVFGVDRSPEMLIEARRNCRDDGVRFLTQDIRCLALPHPVDLVTANFDVVNHLVGGGDLQRALTCIASNLRPGGHLVFDVITNVRPLGQRRVFQRDLQHGDRRIVQTIQWDPRGRLLRGTVLHFARRRAPRVEFYLERGYAPEEVGQALRAAGFVTRGVHDAVTLEPVRSASPRLRIVAQVPTLDVRREPARTGDATAECDRSKGAAAMYFQASEDADRFVGPQSFGASRSYFGQPPAAACASYTAGEIDKSRTAAGLVTPDVVNHPRGLVIRDFGVDWRHLKPSVAAEPALKDWLTTILQIVRSNPTTKIRILGFSDCVGSERDNMVLRRGRAVRVQQMLQQLLGASWTVVQPKITVVDAAPADDYLDANSTVEGRAVNRGVLIEHTREVSFEPDVVQLPDTIERIIKRGQDLIQQTDHFGIRITKYQQERIRCILMRLSQPPFDDRYLTGQGVLDYNNMTYMTAPYYANATQWLLPEFAVKSRKTTPDDIIWRTLVKIDDDIIQGRAKINYFYDTHGAATPIRIQRLRDWVAAQQNNPRSIYSCYR